MSNARSPRDVCSTTMGTSGLMVLALFRVVRSRILPAAALLLDADRASLATAQGPRRRVFGSACAPRRPLDGCRSAGSGALAGLALRRTTRCARRARVCRRRRRARRLAPAACADGIGSACSTSRSTARALARGPRAGRRAGRPCAGARAASRASSSRARPIGLQRVEHVAVGRLDAPRPRRPPRARPRGAAPARRRAGASSSSSSSVLPEICRYASLRCPGATSECSMRSQQLASRAPRPARRGPRPSPARRRRRAPPRGTRPRRAARRPRAARAAMSSRSSSSVSKPAASVGEVVVELGQVLALDLLDRDREAASLPGEVLGAVVVGERRRRRCARSPALRAGRAAPRSRGSGARAELDQLVAARRRPRTARRRRARRSP